MEKIYRGKREEEINIVTVNDLPLLTDGSYDWGKNCQESYNLAYAILLDYFEKDEVEALRFATLFQERVIDIVASDRWKIRSVDVRNEIDKINRIKSGKTADLVRKRAVKVNFK